MKKHTMKQTLVEPRAMMPLVNSEAATRGTARAALNVREQESSLQVAGLPMAIGRIGADERLLLVTGGHYVTCAGQRVLIDGATVATVDGAIVNAHAIGELIVVVTSGGLVYLLATETGWAVMSPEAAIPRLQFTTPSTTTGADIEAYAFAEPYTQWRAPLSTADTTALARLLNSAWSSLNADALAEGRHTAPMLVRWAVRLKDGTYLWMSDPQRVGDITLANAGRISVPVNTGNSGFTGIAASTLPMVSYSLRIDVLAGIAAEWLPLVDRVDVLATPQAQLLTAARSLDYRCVTRTTAPRTYLLEMGLSRRSDAAIAAQLAASSWQVIATAPASATMTGNDFTAPLQPLSLTPAECADVGSMLAVDGVVCSTAAAGRLYCCTRQGSVIVSAPGNALVEVHRRNVLGANPLALAVVTRPLYSGGFGRYPVYVFTDDGIYAIPQSATGTLGEARLVDRTVIEATVRPVEAGRDIWFVSRHHHLCRLSGAALTVIQRQADYMALTWCNAYGELWLLPHDGEPLAMMASGAMSRRSIAASQLWSDAQHALAISPDGQVLDLELERQDGRVAVAWDSHPIGLDVLMARVIKRVVWHVRGDDVDLTLRVMGQRGIMAMEHNVSTIAVSGGVEQPLATAPMAVPARMVRLNLAGQARPGTLILPTILFTIKS